MSLFRAFENRASIENPSIPLTSTTLMDAMGGAPVESGVPVTERSSLHMPAVWRAVSVISSVAASLPLHVYRDNSRDKVGSPLLRDPHPELTPYELWRLTYVHRALWGNAYLQKVRNAAGQVKELWPITPDRVTVERVEGEKVFRITDDEGRHHVLGTRDVGARTGCRDAQDGGRRP